MLSKCIHAYADQLKRNVHACVIDNKFKCNEVRVRTQPPSLQHLLVRSDRISSPKRPRVRCHVRRKFWLTA